MKRGFYGKTFLQRICLFTFLYFPLIMALKTCVKTWFKNTLFLSQVMSEHNQLWSLGIGLHCCGAFTDMVIFIDLLSTPSSSLSSDWSILWKKHKIHIHRWRAFTHISLHLLRHYHQIKVNTFGRNTRTQIFTAEMLLPTFVFIFFIVIIRLNNMFDIKNLIKTNKNVLHTDHPS